MYNTIPGGEIERTSPPKRKMWLTIWCYQNERERGGVSKTDWGVYKAWICEWVRNIYRYEVYQLRYILRKGQWGVKRCGGYPQGEKKGRRKKRRTENHARWRGAASTKDPNHNPRTRQTDAFLSILWLSAPQQGSQLKTARTKKRNRKNIFWNTATTTITGDHSS